MPTIQLERTLVKSPPELWDEIGSAEALGRWLTDVRVSSAEPPNRVEWSGAGARGVIELEPSGWGTRVLARAETNSRPPGFWERFRAPAEESDVERELEALLDGIGSSTLKKA